jgi:Uma2 family endonuclease
MTRLLRETEQSVEGRVVRIAERPIPFSRFIEMAEGYDVELVDGVIVEKTVVQLEHEQCTSWLYQVMGPYVKRCGIGLMLSSRIMVETDEFGGRMPDQLFVRQDRLEIVQQKAVYGAPDLVIEVVSPNDRPSDLRALEADYSRLGVPEVVFIDQRRQSIRLLRLRQDGYAEETILTGEVVFESIAGLSLDAAWLLREPRPDVYDTLKQLLGAE